jgi:hypothetical protein
LRKAGHKPVAGIGENPSFCGRIEPLRKEILLRHVSTEEWRRSAGRKGGLKRRQVTTKERRAAIARRGAAARWAGLSKVERSEAARKAVLARWARARS